MPSTASAAERRLALEEFVAVTQESNENAHQFLRNANYNVAVAVNHYYTLNGKSDNTYRKSKTKSASNVSKTRGSAKDEIDGLEKSLNAMFDELLSEEDVKQNPSRNVMGVVSTIAYIEGLGADSEDYSMFVVLDIVQAETVGQVTRTGFVKGWAQQNVAPEPAAHKKHVRRLCNAVSTDPAYFKKLYDFAFRIGKEPQQKALDMGFAITFWAILFEPTMNSWRSANVNWLEAWTEYLTGRFFVKGDDGADDDEDEEGDDGEEHAGPEDGKDGTKRMKQKDKWTRTVSKDLWTQTALFAAKTLEDESLSFWSEEQAWPGIIDEFVVWCREKGIVATKSAEEGMEVDE